MLSCVVQHEFPRVSFCSPFPYSQLDTICFPRPHTCLSYFPSHISSDKHIHTYTHSAQHGSKGWYEALSNHQTSIPSSLGFGEPLSSPSCLSTPSQVTECPWTARQQSSSLSSAQSPEEASRTQAPHCMWRLVLPLSAIMICL